MSALSKIQCIAADFDNRQVNCEFNPAVSQPRKIGALSSSALSKVSALHFV